MKTSHSDHLPPAAWSKAKTAEHEMYWGLLMQKRERVTQTLKQSSLDSSKGGSQSVIKVNQSSRLSIHEQLQLITEAISVGFLPVTFASNRGLYRLVEGYNHGEYPRGLGDKAIKSNISKTFEDIIRDRKIEFEELLPERMSAYETNDSSDRYKYCRLFAVQHDCWGSRAAKSFLGIVLSFINSWKDKDKWILESYPLACQPFDISHTSENILHTTENILALYGIPLCYLSSATQDTAANAFGSFADVDIVVQNPCAAHRFNLFLNHGFNKCPQASMIIEVVQRLMARLKGFVFLWLYSFAVF